MAAAEKQAKALDLRKAGADFRSIAQELGYAGPSGAHKAVMSALEATLQEPADAVRKLELERLDRLMMGLWPLAAGGKGVTPDLAAVDRVLAIMGRRAALQGLNAPVEQKHAVTNDGAIPVRLIEFTQLPAAPDGTGDPPP